MRDLFLLDRDLTFLNHGSFGACPTEVLLAQHELQREMERNPVEFLGRRSAELLSSRPPTALPPTSGPDAEHLVFVTNATTGSTSWPVPSTSEPGDEIVTTDHEYGACDATWEWVCTPYRRTPRARPRFPLPFERSASRTGCSPR